VIRFFDIFAKNGSDFLSINDYYLSRFFYSSFVGGFALWRAFALCFKRTITAQMASLASKSSLDYVQEAGVYTASSMSNIHLKRVFCGSLQDAKYF